MPHIKRGRGRAPGFVGAQIARNHEAEWLRWHGYRVPEIAAYFSVTRQRVSQMLQSSKQPIPTRNTTQTKRQKRQRPAAPAWPRSNDVGLGSGHKIVS
jgi:hypothetical protein